MSLQHEALKLADAGFYVFPLRPNSKEPLLEGGHKLATRDANKIRVWWTEHTDRTSGHEPNIGCCPGRSGHMVLDLDVKDDKDGVFSFHNLFDDHVEEVPYGPTATTPSGGHHVWFRIPPGEKVGNSAGKLGEGIDVRSINGYVVMPPSRIGNDQYHWNGNSVRKIKAPRAPDWLVTAAGSVYERHPNADKFLCDVDQEQNLERARAYLKNAAPVAIEGQGGNDTTYQVAARVREFGISEGECVKLMALDTRWNGHCEPPWSYGELETIVHNAYRYATNPGGAMAEDPEETFAAIPTAEVEKPEHDPYAPVDGTELADRPPPTWIVDNTVMENSTVLLYGAPGSYKSFLALDMALSLAYGIPWLGHETKGDGRPVVYIAGEGAYGVTQRMKGWMGGNGVTAEPGKFYVIQNMPLAVDDTLMQRLGASMAELKPQMIVVDTVARALAGLDENAAKDTGLLVARYDAVRMAAEGATIVFVHHTGKQENKGARGSTVLPASVDTSIRIKRPRKGEVILTMDKQKEAEDWSDTVGAMKKKAGDSIVFEPHKVIDDSKSALFQNRLHTLKKVLKDAPSLMNTSALARAMADELFDDSEETAATVETLTDAMRSFLRELAKKHPDLAEPYSHGIGANNQRLWGPPSAGLM